MCERLHTQPWVIAAALYGMDEDDTKRATMPLWMVYASIMGYAEAGASGQGPGAITSTSETF